MEERWILFTLVCLGAGGVQAYADSDTGQLCSCTATFFSQLSTACEWGGEIGSAQVNGYAGEEYQSMGRNWRGTGYGRYLYKFADCRTLELQEQPREFAKEGTVFEHTTIGEGMCEHFQKNWVQVLDCQKEDSDSDFAWLPILGTALLLLVGVSASTCICMNTRAERDGYDSVLAPVPSYCDNRSNIVEDDSAGESDRMPADEFMEPDPQLMDEAVPLAAAGPGPARSGGPPGPPGPPCPPLPAPPAPPAGRFGYWHSHHPPAFEPMQASSREL